MTSGPERRRSTRPRAGRPSRSSDSLRLRLAAVSGRPAPRAARARIRRYPKARRPRAVRARRHGRRSIVTDVPAATYRPEVLEPRLGDVEWVASERRRPSRGRSRRSAARTPCCPSASSRCSRATRGCWPHCGGRPRRASRRRSPADGRDEWVLRIGPPGCRAAARRRRRRGRAAIADRQRHRLSSAEGGRQARAAAHAPRACKADTAASYRVARAAGGSAPRHASRPAGTRTCCSTPRFSSSGASARRSGGR